ncbi:MAG: TIGR02611 family protein [Thermoleophilaceae bacterium]|nr:TIGR02611 family protein [Thermoleophilaceae bacterium]
MSDGPAKPEPEHQPELVKKLLAYKERHLEHGRIYRGAFVLAGVIVTLMGLAMLLLPGPAFLVIPIGLAILALEFAWAESLLEKALVQGEKAKQKAAETSTRQRILTGIATALAVAATITAAFVWDIPFLPV